MAERRLRRYVSPLPPSKKENDMYQFAPNVILAALLSNTVAIAPAHGASCTAPHQPASIVQALTPDTPQIAKLEQLTGTTVVQVDLAEDGSVLGSYVARSSGNALLDRAAIQTTKKMAYAPETRRCVHVAGSYAVEVEFTD
jgi:TonB family protein